MPRLELLGCVVLSKLVCDVKNAITSHITLHKICESWFHISGVINPADIPTKLTKSLRNSLDTWINGPRFVRKKVF